METQIKTEKLEKLVAVFDGSIHMVWPNYENVKHVDRVDVIYEFLDHHKIGWWPTQAFISKYIPLVEGTKVKVGMYKDQEGKVGVKVLSDQEAKTYQEPSLGEEILRQKLDYYRLITKNEYNL